VFGSAIEELLDRCYCTSCGEHRLDHSHFVKGTMVVYESTCRDCKHTKRWYSQPFVGNRPAGNILLSAAILFAGATFTKVDRVLRHMGVVSICDRTFYRHQSEVLQPAVRSVWLEQQAWIVAGLQAEETPLVCGGDGRADSPGHCAKYGTYTLIELQKKVIVDIQLVQVQS
jgi:hypothetical protein